MATITSTPTAGSLKVSGTTQKTGSISWSKPTIPSGATISSCVLTGTATASMSKGSATITVNGTTVTSGTQFTINLGTANNTTSVTTTAKGGNKNSSGTVSFSNLVYTVTYEEQAQVKTYTVVFKDWDGTTLKTQTVEEGNNATAPSNPARNGYNFTGWDKSFNNITADTTITAQYSIKTYTVTFKDHDGSTLKTQIVNHGSAATAPSNPSREGYVFTGWDISFDNITSNLTITAQYVPEEPEQPDGPTEGLTQKNATLRPISATQDSGYNNEWTNVTNVYDTDTSTSGTLIVTGTSQGGFVRKYVDTVFNFDNIIPSNAIINSATLIVRCKSSATTNLYLTVNVNGDDTKKVIDNTLMASTSTKDYTGNITSYIKELNYLNLNLTTAGSSSRTFTCYDIRIDVEYQISESKTYYTVTFKDWDGSILKTESVLEGNTATPPSNPTREGYTFSNWDHVYTNVTRDLIVTAQYSINRYTVRFLDHDGTVLSTQTVVYDSAATPPSNPAREGYTFIGWDKPYNNISESIDITAQYKEGTGIGNKFSIGGDIVQSMCLGNEIITAIYIGNERLF